MADVTNHQCRACYRRDARGDTMWVFARLLACRAGVGQVARGVALNAVGIDALAGGARVLTAADGHRWGRRRLDTVSVAQPAQAHLTHWGSPGNHWHCSWYS